jgi:hypothetical protein
LRRAQDSPRIASSWRIGCATTRSTRWSPPRRWGWVMTSPTWRSASIWVRRPRRWRTTSRSDGRDGRWRMRKPSWCGRVGWADLGLLRHLRDSRGAAGRADPGRAGRRGGEPGGARGSDGDQARPSGRAVEDSGRRRRGATRVRRLGRDRPAVVRLHACAFGCSRRSWLSFGIAQVVSTAAWPIAILGAYVSAPVSAGRAVGSGRHRPRRSKPYVGAARCRCRVSVAAWPIRCR